MTRFGDFDVFCRDSTLAICNLMSKNHDQSGTWGGCELKGIPLSGGRHLGNLGVILLSAIAVVMTSFLILLSSRRKAAVGRIEMEVFLGGYAFIQFCEIFTIGSFPLNEKVRVFFTALHIGAIIATTWVLMLNAVVGYQILDDGTPVSVGLVFGSAAPLFLGTVYIAFDTGYSWTGYWDDSYSGSNRHIALYVLYQVAPLIFLAVYFVLETVLVVKVLEEWVPLIWLGGAAAFFALGQVFNYTISSKICNGTSGKIDGSMFETFFTMISVSLVWYFWTTITEDDWDSSAYA
ncbi:Chitin synthase export chaperone [Ceratocystis fimbriata CBS 114723]|uniref:Chitin synthase export chaperone n=1 Tax=Ceratocystis fimbriata CBS 114723 TaxID=1035309 RepID=A0A2C5W5Y0_9PEZI|nr:Chitin synthase export chaperone [Ceratocystis fimbriata CBS 114723]